MKKEIINNEDDIVKFYEDKIHFHASEVERLKKILDTIKGKETSNETKAPQSINSTYPEYPFDKSLLEKFRYLEDEHPNVWKREEMIERMKKAEGTNYKEKNISQKISNYIREGKMYSMRISGSNKYGFFTTRREWIETFTEGKKTRHQIRPEHAPKKEFLGKLSDEQINDLNKIKWNGLR